MMMRLDLLRPPLTGIGYYTLYLLRELLNHPKIDDIIGFSMTGIKHKPALLEQIYHDEQENSTPIALRKSHSLIQGFIQKTPGMYSFLKTVTDMKEGWSIRKYQNWLYHEPSFIALNHNGPTVVTIHDLSHVRYPETHPTARVTFLNKKLPETLKRANHIITVSKFSRDELIALNLIADPSRISVTYLGVDPLFHVHSLAVLKNYLVNLKLTPQAYLLTVATLEPRKNLSRLLKAYNALPEYLKRDFPLVLTGTMGWNNSQFLREIQHIKPPGKVILTGYLCREELAILMSGAAVFVFPSLYEGFGLPVLEAMASGTPVITSNNSALKEISGDCALLMNPLDIDDISDKLQGLLENKDQANMLKAQGIQHAQQFSWKRCADLTVEVYNKAGSS